MFTCVLDQISGEIKFVKVMDIILLNFRGHNSTFIIHETYIISHFSFSFGRVSGQSQTFAPFSKHI